MAGGTNANLAKVLIKGYSYRPENRHFLQISSITTSTKFPSRDVVLTADTNND
jgi:hypothetical protein